MEAESIEDDSLQFNVFIRNIQPGIEIDYKTGLNWEVGEKEEIFILNTRSMKFHKQDCEAVDNISRNNKEEYHGLKSYLILNGYTYCGICGSK